MVGFERILGASRKPLWSDSSPYVSPQQTTGSPISRSQVRNG
jgi:hypothetical protein